MKPVNARVLSAADASSSAGAAIVADQLVSASFQAIFGDVTAAGTVQVQASNDIPPAGNLPASFTPTNWSNVANGSATIAAGATAMIILPQICYRWLRVIYTPTSGGSTTISVEMFAFGV